MTVTIELWVAILMVVIVAVAGLTSGWIWGYTRGDRRWR